VHISKPRVAPAISSKMTYLAKGALLLFYVGVSLFALYKLKVASIGLNVDYLTGVLMYGTSFGLWLCVLRLYPLSVAFPLASGLVIVGTQIVGLVVLHEEFDAPKIAGICLIVVGVVTLATSRSYA
jgi:multidrug transporter EmrE-like cation transporter